MTNSALVSQESIAFRSLPGVPGLEILDAVHTSRNWKWLNTAFGLAVPTTWCCEVRYRNRQQVVEPGMVFCSSPGEIHATQRVLRAGGFHAVMIDAGAFQAYVAEHDVSPSHAEWAKVAAKASPSLQKRLAEVLGLLPTEATAMQVQSAVVALFAALVPELVEGASPKRGTPSANAAAQIRECLHSEEGAMLDLHVLAAKFEMNRFQVVRAFRTRYGVPPHAYQICARVARARTLLKIGHSPSEVAAQCGFADQSHFGRHFKRLVGTTPLRYAQACGGAPHSKFRGEAGEVIGSFAALEKGDQR